MKIADKQNNRESFDTKSITGEDRREYGETRKKYKYLLKVKVKKQSFRRKETTLLATNLNNPATFWKELRNMGCRKQNKANSNNTDINEGQDHFKDIFANNDTDANVQDASQFHISEESNTF